VNELSLLETYRDYQSPLTTAMQSGLILTNRSVSRSGASSKQQICISRSLLRSSSLASEDMIENVMLACAVPNSHKPTRGTEFPSMDVIVEIV
jgi:hypothetical protein